jgi:stage IV sporulation protein FB
MLRFTLFKIPVGIDWWFWLTCALLGGGLFAKTPEDWTRVAVWIVVVFVSILVHEFGHAFAGRRFGVSPMIHLHGLGGATLLPGARFNRRESIFVSAAGPLAGFLLGTVVFLISKGMGPQPYLVRVAISYALLVNFFWTFVNLLPVLPLDGGQIIRDLMGPQRSELTRWIGFFCALGVALWALSIGMIFMAVLFGVFAYHNFNRQPIQGGVIKP